MGAGGGASRAAHSGSPVCGVCLGGWSCPSRAQLAVSALSWPSASCSSAPPHLLDVPTRPQRESAVRGLRDRWPSLQVVVPVLTLRLWADDSAGVSCVDSVRGTFPASASSRGHARSGPSPRLRRGLPPPASPAPSSPDAARGNRSRPGARPWVPLLGVERALGAAPNAEVGASGAGASRGAAGARTAATRGGVGAGPQPPHGAP